VQAVWITCVFRKALKACNPSLSLLGRHLKSFDVVNYQACTNEEICPMSTAYLADIAYSIPKYLPRDFWHEVIAPANQLDLSRNPVLIL